MKKDNLIFLQRLIALFLVINLFFMSLNVESYAVTNLSDINNHWAKNYIQRLVNMNAITGYPDGTFKPNGTISRAAFITVLVKAMKLEPSKCNYFEDTGYHWAQGYISAAVDAGILNVEDYIVQDVVWDKSLFYPDLNIKRQEMAQIITRALGEEYGTVGITKTAFKDNSSITDKLAGYIATASNYGIITGYPSGNFLPSNSATRAEACVMITRLLDQLEMKPDLTEISTENIYQSYSKGVVMISGFDEDGDEYELGSGFVYEKTGKVITNYHVIDGMNSLQVTFTDGSKKKVTSIHNYDRSYDVAVLNLETGIYSTVPLGNSRRLNIGEEIYTLGYPLVKNLTISDGLISSNYNDQDGHNYIQISAPISPGSSGGALVDKYGRVVGITSSGFSRGENMNLAIPICDVLHLVLANDQKLSVQTSCLENPSIKDILNYLYDDEIIVTDDLEIKSHSFLHDIYQDDYQYIGFMAVLKHKVLAKNNIFTGKMEILDDYGQVVYNDYKLVRIYPGSETKLKYLFRFDIDDLGPGVYDFNFYINDEYITKDSMVIKSDRKYSTYSPLSTSIATFDYDHYAASEKNEVLPATQFKSYSTNHVGFDVNASFSQPVESFTSLVYSIEITSDNGYNKQFYVEGQMYSGTKSLGFYTGFGRIPGEYPPGDYNVSLIYGEEVIATTSFKVTADSDCSLSPQALQISEYLDTSSFQNVNKPELSGEYFLTIPIQLGSISKLTSLRLDYAIRCGDIIDKHFNATFGYSNLFFVKPEDSNTSYKMDFGRFSLTNEIKEKYLAGEDIFIDIYINDNFIGTTTYEPSIPIVENKLFSAIIWASQYTNYGSEFNYKDEPFEKFSALEKQMIDLSDNQCLYYVFDFEVDVDSVQGYLVDYLYIELINNNTKEIVDSKTYIYSNIKDYIVKTVLKDKPQIVPGDYTLNVYIDRVEMPVYSKSYKFVK